MAYRMLPRFRALYERVPDEHGRLLFWGTAVAALIPAGVMAWLFAQVDWYWQALGLAGVAVAGLVAWLIIAFGFAEYQRAALLSERRKRSELQSPRPAVEDDSEPTYEGPHEKLMLFVVGHLLPTCSARELLHAQIIRALCPNGPIAPLAQFGAQQAVPEYAKGQEGLEGLSDSPPEFIPFEKMVESVKLIEKSYIKFQGESVRLARSGYVDPSVKKPVADLWEEWRVAHNEMVAAYEPIKRDSKMGVLFRPARESWWGPTIPPATTELPIPLMLREPERKT